MNDMGTHGLVTHMYWCGAPDATFALKLGKTDSGALWNEYAIHKRVFSEFNSIASLRRSGSEIHVPRRHWHASATDDELWS